jgi:hypothetical protein
VTICLHSFPDDKQSRHIHLHFPPDGIERADRDALATPTPAGIDQCSSSHTRRIEATTLSAAQQR